MRKLFWPLDCEHPWWEHELQRLLWGIEWLHNQAMNESASVYSANSAHTQTLQTHINGKICKTGFGLAKAFA